MPSIRSGPRHEALQALVFGLVLAAALSAPPEALAMVVDRCGSDTEAGGTNLAAALAQGGPITFSCASGATIRVTTPIDLTRSVDIDGGGRVTLDGNNEIWMLNARGPDIEVRLSNLTIRRIAVQSGTDQGVINGAKQVLLAKVRVAESDSPISTNGAIVIEDSDQPRPYQRGGRPRYRPHENTHY